MCSDVAVTEISSYSNFNQAGIGSTLSKIRSEQFLFPSFSKSDIVI